jgi:hypothetical protein
VNSERQLQRAVCVKYNFKQSLRPMRPPSTLQEPEYSMPTSTRSRFTRLPTAVKILAVSLISYTGASCLAVPTSNPVTAKSLQPGEWMTSTGYGDINVYLRQDYGVTDKWDVGIYAEAGIGTNLGVTAKYTLPELSESLEWAAIIGLGVGRAEDDELFGIGETITTTGYFASLGTIFSYPLEEQKLELYFSPRIIAGHVSHEVIFESEAELFPSAEETANLFWAVANLGATFWIFENYALTGSILGIINQEGDERGLFSIGLVFRY